MTDLAIHHATLLFERSFDVPVSAVFAAFSDPAARARWGAPSDTAALVYDEADFRIGGRDVFRCGAKSDLRYRGETRYVDIARDRRIVATEVIDELDRRLSAAVTTLEFEPEREGARLKLTVQLASLDGPGMIEGSRMGYAGALDNLDLELRRGKESRA
jgi:uncharacterized protein YndB with AHSA1/START domain